MPIYEYKCKKCGVFEVMQRISEAPLKKCPTCKEKVERQMSRGSFILKGSGWYATDYAKKSSGANGDGDAAASNPAGNGDSTSAGESSSKASDAKTTSETKSSSESKPSSDAKRSSESKSSGSKSSESKSSASAKSAD